MRIALALLVAALAAWWWFAQDDAPDAPPAPPLEETGIDPTITFTSLKQGDVHGGEAVTLLPGTPEQILAAITDFEHAAAHRSFAEAMEVLATRDDSTEVALTLKGRVGVNPKIHVRYTTKRDGDAIEVHYQLTKKAFGIARYEGRYRIDPVEGRPPRSRFRSRIFVSSGIALMKVDHEDIEQGQRTDQAELRAWLHERLDAQ